MNIGEKIRNAREDLDLSQEEVARQIPMSQSGYSKIERNVQEPSLMQLRRIVKFLTSAQIFFSHSVTLTPFPKTIWLCCSI